jgi:homoserine dehydrogenase
MKVQLIGLGHVGQSLIELIDAKRQLLNSLDLEITVVSVSDSKGTAVDEKGLDPRAVMKYKRLGWKGFDRFVRGYDALDAIRNIESDIVVELTPSTPDGEPGLSNINAALTTKKHVVTSNKGPLAVAYSDLMRTAGKNNVRLLHEATVAAHVPVFCMIESCFKADEIQGLKGILNSTTNFIIGEMEKGKGFQEALEEAITAGWTEKDYSDDVDGIDAARKLVIMANALFGKNARLEDVQTKGIRNIRAILNEALKAKRKVKLVCEIRRVKNKLEMTVSPRQIPLDDPWATVNQGNMGIKFTFKTSKEVFVSAQFQGPWQTAYAVLNDIVRIATQKTSC